MFEYPAYYLAGQLYRPVAEVMALLIVHGLKIVYVADDHADKEPENSPEHSHLSRIRIAGYDKRTPADARSDRERPTTEFAETGSQPVIR